MGIEIRGVCLTPLKKIEADAGNIFHIMRDDSETYSGFGEVYISTIKHGNKKGWKRHREMTLNIVVPIGEIRFVLFDDRMGSPSEGKKDEFILSPKNYHRLTVPPGIWMAFEGLSAGESFLINFANIKHDPSEADTLDLTNKLIPYEWK